jgi:hypothetical protein
MLIDSLPVIDLRASHPRRSAPAGSVVDLAIERKRNFRRFVRFSKKFFAKP